MLPTEETFPSIRSFIPRMSPIVSVSWSKRFSASLSRLAVFETRVPIWAICRIDPMIAWPGRTVSSSAAQAATARILFPVTTCMIDSFRYRSAPPLGTRTSEVKYTRTLWPARMVTVGRRFRNRSVIAMPCWAMLAPAPARIRSPAGP